MKLDMDQVRREGLGIWTIFERPSDYPDFYVAHLQYAWRGHVITTNERLFATSLDGVRAKLPPHLTPMLRHPNDEPHIVETWF